MELDKSSKQARRQEAGSLDSNTAAGSNVAAGSNNSNTAAGSNVAAGSNNSNTAGSNSSNTAVTAGSNSSYTAVTANFRFMLRCTVINPDSPWFVVDSYLNLRDTVYNRMRTLLVPVLSVVSPFEAGFTTVHHDYISRVESW